MRKAHLKGRQAALHKFALGPPLQVDQFMADVEQGKDLPVAALPPASHVPPALDDSTPMPPPPPMGAGSTVGGPQAQLAGAPPAEPPQSMGALRG